MCTWHYGEITDSTYSSYEDVKFAHGHKIDILPLRMCDDPWPPEPPSGPDHPHDNMAMAFHKSRIYVDCRGKDAHYITAKIAETLCPTPGEGAGLLPSPRTAASSTPEAKGADTGAPSSTPAGPIGPALRKAKDPADSVADAAAAADPNEEAKECFLKALDLDENDAIAWNELGVSDGGTLRENGCYRKPLELKVHEMGASQCRSQPWHHHGCLGDEILASCCEQTSRLPLPDTESSRLSRHPRGLLEALCSSITLQLAFMPSGMEQCAPGINQVKCSRHPGRAVCQQERDVSNRPSSLKKAWIEPRKAPPCSPQRYDLLIGRVVQGIMNRWSGCCASALLALPFSSICVW